MEIEKEIKQLRKEERKFLKEWSPELRMVSIVSVLIILGTVAFSAFTIVNMNSVITDLRTEIADLKNQVSVIDKSGKLVELLSKMSKQKYALTELGAEFADGDLFSAEEHRYTIQGMPEIVFNCQYSRTGTYVNIDAELEKLDLKNATCVATGLCQLTPDEAAQLADKIRLIRQSDLIQLVQFRSDGCGTRIEMLYSPTSAFCTSQYPILRNVINEIGIEGKVLCVPFRSADAELCNLLPILKGKNEITIESLAQESTLGVCQLSTALEVLESFALLEKI